MRTVLRIALALLMVAALSTAAFAQTDGERVSLNAIVGPAFASVGTTFATAGALTVRVSDRISLSGEAGILPHAPFREADKIAPPAPFESLESLRVNASHWNGNVTMRPFAEQRFTPYVTAGIGSFTADTVGDRRIDGRRFEERRRATDLATNVGAGVTYRFSPWLGLGADYRTFFVHRDHETPGVHRFTVGLSVSIK